jgi:hypothetical protein
MVTTPYKSPPRYVPTLTQVVDKSALAAAEPPAGLSRPDASKTTGAPVAAQSAAGAHINPSPELLAQQIRQQLLVQTRQYIDTELQRRLREAVSQLALEHAHKMFEELQPHLEATVSQVVDEAIKHAVAYAAVHAP